MSSLLKIVTASALVAIAGPAAAKDPDLRSLTRERLDAPASSPKAAPQSAATAPRPAGEIDLVPAPFSAAAEAAGVKETKQEAATERAEPKTLKRVGWNSIGWRSLGARDNAAEARTGPRRSPYSQPGAPNMGDPGTLPMINSAGGVPQNQGEGRLGSGVSPAGPTAAAAGAAPPPVPQGGDPVGRAQTAQAIQTAQGILGAK
ncbi:MAG: hypothetical protein HY078_13275 [Elusimicrobia bacterium]|nr:hypothetical protein [Elusimicrobiota bacterium]